MGEVKYTYTANAIFSPNGNGNAIEMPVQRSKTSKFPLYCGINADDIGNGYCTTGAFGGVIQHPTSKYWSTPTPNRNLKFWQGVNRELQSASHLLSSNESVSYIFNNTAITGVTNSNSATSKSQVALRFSESPRIINFGEKIVTSYTEETVTQALTMIPQYSGMHGFPCGLEISKDGPGYNNFGIYSSVIGIPLRLPAGSAFTQLLLGEAIKYFGHGLKMRISAFVFRNTAVESGNARPFIDMAGQDWLTFNVSGVNAGLFPSKPCYIAPYIPASNFHIGAARSAANYQQNLIALLEGKTKFKRQLQEEAPVEFPLVSGGNGLLGRSPSLITYLTDVCEKPLFSKIVDFDTQTVDSFDFDYPLTRELAEGKRRRNRTDSQKPYLLLVMTPYSIIDSNGSWPEQSAGNISSFGCIALFPSKTNYYLA